MDLQCRGGYCNVECFHIHTHTYYLLTYPYYRQHQQTPVPGTASNLHIRSFIQSRSCSLAGGDVPTHQGFALVTAAPANANDHMYRPPLVRVGLLHRPDPLLAPQPPTPAAVVRGLAAPGLSQGLAAALPAPAAVKVLGHLLRGGREDRLQVGFI
eukprot:scaffold148743_cov28-Prasinocladus_malaysianus.AAC.2